MSTSMHSLPSTAKRSSDGAAKVVRRSVPPPTVAEIDHGEPRWLDQRVGSLRLGLSSILEIGGSAVLYGHNRRGAAADHGRVYAHPWGGMRLYRRRPELPVSAPVIGPS